MTLMTLSIHMYFPPTRSKYHYLTGKNYRSQHIHRHKSRAIREVVLTMVFNYTIRGGPCLNASSHITLSSSDITCYVGADKHENEFLIKYGWPGDIWVRQVGARRLIFWQWRDELRSNPLVALLSSTWIR